MWPNLKYDLNLGFCIKFLPKYKITNQYEKNSTKHDLSIFHFYLNIKYKIIVIINMYLLWWYCSCMGSYLFYYLNKKCYPKTVIKE